MKITRDDDFGGCILNCAVRYCLGRMSYMPGLVMDEIRPMLNDCSDKTLWCFDRDITDWLNERERMTDKYSISEYREEWTNFRNEVRKAIEKRKQEAAT